VKLSRRRSLGAEFAGPLEEMAVPRLAPSSVSYGDAGGEPFLERRPRTPRDANNSGETRARAVTHWGRTRSQGDGPPREWPGRTRGSAEEAVTERSVLERGAAECPTEKPASDEGESASCLAHRPARKPSSSHAGRFLTSRITSRLPRIIKIIFAFEQKVHLN
jgi:hypothetical protein